jgi:hypothetical protein
MKNSIYFKYLSAILWLSFSIATPNLDAAEKTGYEVDGRTSASVLTAKRSHRVASSDELGLSIYSGLLVIAVIAFFSRQWFDRK